jgi:hypothetical protein
MATTVPKTEVPDSVRRLRAHFQKSRRRLALRERRVATHGELEGAAVGYTRAYTVATNHEQSDAADADNFRKIPVPKTMVRMGWQTETHLPFPSEGVSACHPEERSYVTAIRARVLHHLLSPAPLRAAQQRLSFALILRERACSLLETRMSWGQQHSRHKLGLSSASVGARDCMYEGRTPRSASVGGTARTKAVSKPPAAPRTGRNKMSLRQLKMIRDSCNDSAQAWQLAALPIQKRVTGNYLLSVRSTDDDGHRTSQPTIPEAAPVQSQSLRQHQIQELLMWRAGLEKKLQVCMTPTQRLQ